MTSKMIVKVHEGSNGMPENLDGIRFQFHNDDSVTAYAWSADDYDDEECQYCEDVEVNHEGVRVISVERAEDDDYGLFTIEVDLDQITLAQKIWKDTYKE